MTKAQPTSKRTLNELVKRCANLCNDAERALRKLSTEREGFLAQNLDSALQQVELILRTIGENHDENRDAARQSLLGRLFGRGGGDESGEVKLPSFDVSSQGLQGNSWTISLAELLGFLSFARKTGLLWIDSLGENFLVGLVGGRLMHLSSDRTPEGLRLGEVLVGLGFLTRRQLERFLTADGKDNTVSGESLLENGMISDDELAEALGYQVKKLFARVIDTPHAIFRFQEGINVQLAYHVDLDVNQLLLDSSRVHDEDENPAELAASVLREWNSWRQELGGKLALPADDDEEVAEELAAVTAEADANEQPEPPAATEPRDSNE